MKRNTLKAYGSVIAATAIQALGSGKAFADFSTANTVQTNDTSVTNTGGLAGFKNMLVNIGNNTLGVVTIIITIIAVFYLIFSGYQYVTSAGDPEKAKKARAGIINSIIGIIIIASAWAIISFATNAGSATSGAVTGGAF